MKLEEIEERFFAIETHEDGYDFARNHFHSLIAIARIAKKILYADEPLLRCTIYDCVACDLKQAMEELEK